jgi:NTP pyrophosphatase (non-canonical NTP hydrolase)
LKTKTIALPRLNNLQPSLESTALKLMEEAGELGAAISRFKGLNGVRVEGDRVELAKNVSRELLDVAQTAVTMMYVLEEQYGLDLEAVLAEHVEKLMKKGYLSL